MNESTAGGAVLAPLKALQDILHNRIIQKEGEIHILIVKRIQVAYQGK
jgi:hypothetical protein